MIVYLLRHGEAEDVGAGGARTDADRRLTETGRRRLQQASSTWRRCVGEVDHIYTSTLVRARQTADLFAEAVGHRDAIEVGDWLVPEADPDIAVRACLADAAAGRTGIALVGHEPHLGDLLARFLLGRGAIPLKKGMLVGVELLAPAAASGRLVFCLSTKLATRLDAD